ncbi:hypothetical protein E1176_06565 [Fulvivirga sp. RKSG066]|uniref:DUF3566 domain-containing protein n=1 Tax=Fulvivirga aurantia TaxID=2529383 RepID=UPI0012BB5ADE|nr:DUF3566 domain-containing protein [Fulvivirga aurantia]MTI20678.1 hypothetical protein [Fulvivirga aurantia]
MERLKKVSVWSFAKFQTVLGALIGLVCGILYAFGGLVIDALVSAGVLSPEAMSTPGLSIGTLLAFGALIGMPVIFGFFGMILGILEALLYNQYAKWFGGIRIHF